VTIRAASSIDEARRGEIDVGEREEPSAVEPAEWR
jgi:hypothetical protein